MSLSDELLCRVALARLRLPVPTSKLATVHGLSRALDSPDLKNVLWQSIIEWVSSLELESEVLEALTILILAKENCVVSTTELRNAIQCPSPLSDLFLQQIAKSPILVNSWAKAHSLEAPPFFQASGTVEQLASGRSCPAILTQRFEELEQRTRKRFVKQWAYEYEGLVNRLGTQTDGYWEYFSQDSDRKRQTGPFITRKSHLARSAYLRALHLAFDVWGMPEELVFEEAAYASPVDFSFLPLLPDQQPQWLSPLFDGDLAFDDDWEKLVSALQANGESVDRFPLYVSCSRQESERCKVSLEVISCLYNGDRPSVDGAFSVHHFVPGRVEIPRNDDGSIEVRSLDPVGPFPDNGSEIYAALLPCVINAGYFHSDLISRMPYLPANYRGDQTSLSAVPRTGGMDIFLDGSCVGELDYWNWRWSPTADKDLGPACGTALSLSKEAKHALFDDLRLSFVRCWNVKILSRESDYGDWSLNEIQGYF